jgi:flagellar basal body-associated protein FliL
MYNGPQGFRKKKAKIFLLIPLLLLVVSGLVMFLWNAILPSLLGVKFITYWQAAGLLLLCKILFGGFSFGRKHGPPGMSFRERWEKSAEEKEKIRAEWRSRCRPKKSED